MNKECERVKRASDKIMSRVDDPFHDEIHIREITETALRIYDGLPPHIQHTADTAMITLACLLHDTSRRIIKTHLILQPLIDGIVSGSYAYNILLRAGYDKTTARHVQHTISAHESLFAPFQPNRRREINFQIFHDSDTIEKYSTARLERGLARFEQKLFSPLLFNSYMASLAFKEKHTNRPLHFDISQTILKEYQSDMKTFLITNKKRMDALLYPRVSQYFYTMHFLR